MEKPTNCPAKGTECIRCVEIGLSAVAIVLKSRGIDEPRRGLLIEGEIPNIRARVQNDPGVVALQCPARQSRATRIGVSQAEQIIDKQG